MSDIQNKIRRAMTVGDLRRQLENFDDETLVLFACNYGDYHNTQQALPVEEIEEMGADDLETSAYSQSGLTLARESDYDEDEDEMDDEYKAERAELADTSIIILT